MFLFLFIQSSKSDSCGNQTCSGTCIETFYNEELHYDCYSEFYYFFCHYPANGYLIIFAVAFGPPLLAVCISALFHSFPGWFNLLYSFIITLSLTLTIGPAVCIQFTEHLILNVVLLTLFVIAWSGTYMIFRICACDSARMSDLKEEYHRRAIKWNEQDNAIIKYNASVGNYPLQRTEMGYDQITPQELMDIHRDNISISPKPIATSFAYHLLGKERSVVITEQQSVELNYGSWETNIEQNADITNIKDKNISYNTFICLEFDPDMQQEMDAKIEESQSLVSNAGKSFVEKMDDTFVPHIIGTSSKIHKAMHTIFFRAFWEFLVIIGWQIFLDILWESQIDERYESVIIKKIYFGNQGRAKKGERDRELLQQIDNEVKRNDNVEQVSIV